MHIKRGLLRIKVRRSKGLQFALICALTGFVLLTSASPASATWWNPTTWLRTALSTPVIDPASKTVTTGDIVHVVITNNSPNSSQVRYTTNGSEPTWSSAPFLPSGMMVNPVEFDIPPSSPDIKNNKITVMAKAIDLNNISTTSSTTSETYTYTNATPTVSFTSTSQTTTSENGTYTVTAQLSVAATQIVSVPYSLNTPAGTAVAQDYSVTPASPLSIPFGQTSASVSFTVTDDVLSESNETIVVTMGTPTNASKGSTATHTITITDNDRIVNFDLNSALSQSESGDYSLKAYLNSNYSTNVSVPLTLTGTATNGTDYSFSLNPITIIAGQTIGTSTLSIKPDASQEGDETVIITMGDVSPNIIKKGTYNSVTFTIKDDDSYSSPIINGLTLTDVDANADVANNGEVYGPFKGKLTAHVTDSDTNLSNVSTTFYYRAKVDPNSSSFGTDNTEDNGSYEYNMQNPLDPSEDTTYIFSAKAWDGNSWSNEPSIEFTVLSCADTDPNAVTPLSATRAVQKSCPTTTLTVIAHNFADQPISGANIKLNKPDGTSKTQPTDSSGNTKFGPMKVGTYSYFIESAPTGFITTPATPVSKKLSGTVSDTLKIRKYGTLPVTVTTDSGQPVNGASVYISTDPNALCERDPASGQPISTYTTDANGQVYIEHLKPDTKCTIFARKEGYSDSSAKTETFVDGAKTQAPSELKLAQAKGTVKVWIGFPKQATCPELYKVYGVATTDYAKMYIGNYGIKLDDISQVKSAQGLPSLPTIDSAIVGQCVMLTDPAILGASGLTKVPALSIQFDQSVGRWAIYSAVARTQSVDPSLGDENIPLGKKDTYIEQGKTSNVLFQVLVNSKQAKNINKKPISSNTVAASFTIYESITQLAKSRTTGTVVNSATGGLIALATKTNPIGAAVGFLFKGKINKAQNKVANKVIDTADGYLFLPRTQSLQDSILAKAKVDGLPALSTQEIEDLKKAKDTQDVDSDGDTNEPLYPNIHVTKPQSDAELEIGMAYPFFVFDKPTQSNQNMHSVVILESLDAYTTTMTSAQSLDDLKGIINALQQDQKIFDVKNITFDPRIPQRVTWITKTGKQYATK